MKYHDTRGEYDKIARWLEANDVEIDWEEVMKSEWWVGPPDWVPPPKWSMPKPFPRPIPPQTVTKLILAQVNHGLPIPCWLTEGGEGVEPAGGAASPTGPSRWEIFLQRIAELPQTNLTIKLITPEERRAIVRMAWIEEELRAKALGINRARVMRQARGEVEVRVSRWNVKRLVRSACRGGKEAIRELEARGVVSREQIGRWRAISERKERRCEEMRQRKKRKSLFWPEGGSVKKESEKKKKGVEGEEGPVEVELEVMRVGPNPRILTCRYVEGGEERRVTVRVKSVGKFVKGMKVRMERPVNRGNGEAWEYGGVLPRFVGRW